MIDLTKRNADGTPVGPTFRTGSDGVDAVVLELLGWTRTRTGAATTLPPLYTAQSRAQAARYRDAARRQPRPAPRRQGTRSAVIAAALRDAA